MVPISSPGRVPPPLRVRRSVRVGRLLQLGQTKVRQFRVAIFRNQDIRRLDIAVQDSGRVRGRQPVGYAGQHLHRLAPRMFLLFGPGMKCPAVHEFGYQVLPALEITGVVDSQNVRMVERGGHLCLTLKAVTGRGVGQLRRQELDRHRPVELGIDGAKHFTHAAGA